MIGPAIRHRLVTTALGTIVALGMGGAFFVALEPPASSYSVQQVIAGMRMRPNAWVGRTVRVRGVAMPIDVGLVWQGTILTAATRQLPRLMRDVTPLSPSHWQVDAPGYAAVLILQRTAHAPTHSAHVRLLDSLIAAFARLPLLASVLAAAHPDPGREQVYRVRLVAAPHCPAPFIGPCPTGIEVP